MVMKHGYWLLLSVVVFGSVCIPYEGFGQSAASGLLVDFVMVKARKIVFRKL
jgi:hypothetical protein